MKRLVSGLIAALSFISVSNAASAATETFTFEATLTEGNLICGRFVGEEGFCPSLIGAIDIANDPLDDFMFGMRIGYSTFGRIDLIYADGVLVDGTCRLNGKNCAFGQAFFPLGSAPLGSAPGFLDFGTSSTVVSAFYINEDKGSFRYATDYITANGPNYNYVQYYKDVLFRLHDITYVSTLQPVPLPATLPGLVIAFGALGLFRQRSCTARRS